MIWDTSTGRTRVRSLLHDHAVRNILFSPDGKRLLTVDFQGLRIWNAADGDPVTVHLDQHIAVGIGFQNSSGMAQFSPDGNSVLHASGSRTPLLWEVPVPPANIPSWFPEFLEAVAGQTFIPESDMPIDVPTTRFLTLKKQILESNNEDYYTKWAKVWLKE